ncbi:unnamed protein product [Strongylus vulgaris]|uniref:Uncharacterized protein n=1 Tax=Strongylus vulgaris TaxID=40348 RepID=A0A3P7IV24_STRVU|nr:unnamed protein product [Strongylus vulgaris]
MVWGRVEAAPMVEAAPLLVEVEASRVVVEVVAASVLVEVEAASVLVEVEAASLLVEVEAASLLVEVEASSVVKIRANSRAAQLHPTETQSRREHPRLEAELQISPVESPQRTFQAEVIRSAQEVVQ